MSIYARIAKDLEGIYFKLYRVAEVLGQVDGTQVRTGQEVMPSLSVGALLVKLDEIDAWADGMINKWSAQVARAQDAEPRPAEGAGLTPAGLVPVIVPLEVDPRTPDTFRVLCESLRQLDLGVGELLASLERMEMHAHALDRAMPLLVESGVLLREHALFLREPPAPNEYQTTPSPSEN